MKEVKTQVSLRVAPKQKNVPGLKLIAKLNDPEELKYWEIPTVINISIHLDNEEQEHLTDIIMMDMTCGYYGDIAVGVMDSHDVDWGMLGLYLFDRQGYKVGNVAFFDCSGGPEPSEKLFTYDFDTDGLIDGIVTACDILMQSSERKADYFAFYGNTEMWPPDLKWKRKFRQCGYHIFNGPYPVNFFAVRNAAPQHAKITICDE